MTVLHGKIPIFYFHPLSKVFMNFSCIRVYQNWRKIKRVIFPKVQVPGPIKFCQIYQSTNQNKQKINCRACSDDPFSEWGTVICYLGSLFTIICTPLAHFWSPLIGQVGQVVDKKLLGTGFFLAYQKTQLHTCSLPGYSNVSRSKKKMMKKIEKFLPTTFPL